MKITRVPVDHPEAVAVLREYVDDVASRYYGRQATDEEIDRALAEDPSDDVVLFFLARDGEEVLGCVGVRFAEPTVAELTRMFVKPTARGRGVASALLRTAEEEAVRNGTQVMRLDTRADLVEARALYAKHGYQEVEPYGERLYADHWLVKNFPAARRV
ncbi:GNAT family N-acetyltransferase [Amycolatopsis sacchari]|uniref:GNAT family N-acetyltransferase n=1 Tax=Amycolatopsis sacchari TaxID=115433 RepID=UPI003D719E5B